MKCIKNNYLVKGNEWQKMEYSHYVLKTNEFDEAIVMNEISRAKRRFYLRLSFIVNHVRLIGFYNTVAFIIKYMSKMVHASLHKHYGTISI